MAQIINGQALPNTDAAHAAPVESAPIADKPAANKLAPLFGLVSFARPNTDTVSEKYGRKSTPMVNFSVELPRVGLKIDSTIWARLQPLKDGSGDEIIPDTALPRNVIALSADAKDAFTDYINGTVQKWAGFDRAYDDATNRLLGRTGKKDAKRVTIVPRLVKRSVDARPASGV